MVNFVVYWKYEGGEVMIIFCGDNGYFRNVRIGDKNICVEL